MNVYNLFLLALNYDINLLFKKLNNKVFLYCKENIDCMKCKIYTECSSVPPDYFLDEEYFLKIKNKYPEYLI